MKILQRALMVVTSAAAAAMALVSLICLANPHRPLFYLIDIFTLAGFSGAIVLAALLWWLRQTPAKWIASGAVLIFVLAVWPQAFPRQPAPDHSQPAVRLVFANMLIRNTTPEKILPWIEKQKPDIVAMVEVNPARRQALIEKLRTGRPYVATRYDMIIVSRWPLTSIEKGGTGFGLLTACVRAPGGDINLAVTHLTRPWPFSEPEDQRRQFARLGSAVTSETGSRFVMVGDFNTPPLASGMSDFVRAHDLHTAPAVGGTWPTFLPGFLRVTIDNAMASGDLHLGRRKTGPFDGSDHRPIVVDIRPAKAR